MRSALRNLTVSGDDGQLMERKSLTARRSAGSAWKVAPAPAPAGAGAGCGSGWACRSPAPLGEGLTDPPHAEDPEALPGHVGAEHEQRVPAVPTAASHEAVALRPRRGRREDAEHRGVGGRVGEDVGVYVTTIPTSRARRHVDVLVPDRVGRDDAERPRHLPPAPRG